MYYTLQKVLQMTLEQEKRIENKNKWPEIEKKIMQEKKQMEFIIRSEYCFLSLFALFSRNSYYYVNNVASVAHKSVLGCFTCSFKITLGLEVLNSFLSPKYLIKIHFFQAI